MGSIADGGSGCKVGGAGYDQVAPGPGAARFEAMSGTLSDAIADAMKVLTTETGLEVDVLFGDRVLDPSQMSSRAAHAVGLIEGAAIMAGMTALELLDEVRAE